MVATVPSFIDRAEEFVTSAQPASDEALHMAQNAAEVIFLRRLCLPTYTFADTADVDVFTKAAVAPLAGSDAPQGPNFSVSPCEEANRALDVF